VKRERLRPAAMLRGHGIEIGALHLPLKLGQHASVTYVDRLPVEKLRELYVELADMELAPVDVIGSAEDLSSFENGSLDFVIANHIIEHLEDPIKALKEFHRVLKTRGLLFMCVPDARVTFDRLRPLTDTEHILVEHRGGPKATGANRRDHYADWVVHVERSGILGDLHRPVTASTNEEFVQKLVDMDYSIHFHVWNADTFLDFFHRVCREEQLDMEVLDAVDTTGRGSDELILLIGKQPTIVQRLRARQLREESWSWNLKEMLKATPAAPVLRQVRRVLRRA
jgi:predicted SAM-dependent methyltransferase